MINLRNIACIVIISSIFICCVQKPYKVYANINTKVGGTAVIDINTYSSFKIHNLIEGILKYVFWYSDIIDDADNVDNENSSDYWRQEIVNEAIYWSGRIPYCYDGKAKTQLLDKSNPPLYMDCSGFTSSIYKTVLNIDIGSNTGIQKNRGVPVSLSDLEPGDLIFFDWPDKQGIRSGITDHVGIYIGDANFISESGSNTNSNNLENTKIKQNVKINNLNTNWGNSGGIKYGVIKDNICGIRRIIQDDNTFINNPSVGVQALPLKNNN